MAAKSKKDETKIDVKQQLIAINEEKNSVNEWLNNLKLSKYAQLFEENEFDDMDAVRLIHSEQRLIDIGIGMGARLKIMHSLNITAQSQSSAPIASSRHSKTIKEVQRRVFIGNASFMKISAGFPSPSVQNCNLVIFRNSNMETQDLNELSLENAGFMAIITKHCVISSQYLPTDHILTSQDINPEEFTFLQNIEIKHDDTYIQLFNQYDSESIAKLLCFKNSDICMILSNYNDKLPMFEDLQIGEPQKPQKQESVFFCAWNTLGVIWKEPSTQSIEIIGIGENIRVFGFGLASPGMSGGLLFDANGSLLGCLSGRSHSNAMVFHRLNMNEEYQDILQFYQHQKYNQLLLISSQSISKIEAFLNFIKFNVKSIDVTQYFGERKQRTTTIIKSPMFKPNSSSFQVTGPITYL